MSTENCIIWYSPVYIHGSSIDTRDINCLFHFQTVFIFKSITFNITFLPSYQNVMMKKNNTWVILHTRILSLLFYSTIQYAIAIFCSAWPMCCICLAVWILFFLIEEGFSLAQRTKGTLKIKSLKVLMLASTFKLTLWARNICVTQVKLKKKKKNFSSAFLYILLVNRLSLSLSPSITLSLIHSTQ